jgi:hypothetical protein
VTILSDGVNAGDSVSQNIFQEVSSTLTEAIGVADSPLQTIFKTVTTTLSETVSVTDSTIHNIFHTIAVTLSDGLSAVDQLFAPPSVQVTFLTIEAHSPVNILITAPTGAQAGFGVGGASVDQLGANMTGPGTEPETVTIPEPSIGYYQILVAGTPSAAQSGSPYTITVESVGENGNNLSQWSETGTATPGSTGYLSVYLLSNGTVSTTLPVASTGNEFLYIILGLVLVGVVAVLLVNRRTVNMARAPKVV